MADPRYFIDRLVPLDAVQDAQYAVVAPADDLHHMVNVARITPGERIEVVTRDDWQPYAATVAAVDRAGALSITLADLHHIEVATAPYRVTLAFGIAKGDKTDTIVRQAVEIGVDRILPVMFERSVVRLEGDKVQSRQARLQSIAESAARQSHQRRVPTVDMPGRTEIAVSAAAEHDLVLVAWEEARELELTDAIAAHVEPGRQSDEPLNVMVVIGPEGGIAAREVAQLEAAGAVAVSLGSSILRVDTAAAVALGTTFDALRRAYRRGK